MKHIPQSDIASTGEFTQAESLPVPYEIPGHDEDVLSGLSEQTQIEELGFISIKTNKGSTSFNAGPLGDIEGPLRVVLMDVDPIRTLWPMGMEDAVEDVQKWSRAPICQSRSKWNGDVLAQPGWIKGEILKPIDGDCPEQARSLIEAAMDSNLICGKCEWAKYGSHYTGSGQACRAQKRLLVWLVEEQTIAVIVVTPASLKNWHNFALALQGHPKSERNIDITSTVVEKSAQIQYNKISFTFAKDKKEFVKTTNDQLRGLKGFMNYKGTNMPLFKAYISEFRNLDIEYESEDEEPVDDMKF